MNWFKDLYDDFRMKRTFGSVSDERTKQDVDFIIDVLNLPKGGKMLDLFCGLGRHSIELAERGYNAVGIEYNSEYLKLARAKAQKKGVVIEFIHGDVRHVEFGVDYDAAIIMYQSFGYFTDEEDKMVLHKIYNALKQNGRFLIEILSKDWILNNFVENEVTEVNGIKIDETRAFDAPTSRVNFTINRHLEEGVVTKKGSWRLYSSSEITSISDNIGFKYIAGYNDLDKNPLTKNTRLMHLVFEK